MHGKILDKRRKIGFWAKLGPEEGLVYVAMVMVFITGIAMLVSSLKVDLPRFLLGLSATMLAGCALYTKWRKTKREVNHGSNRFHSSSARRQNRSGG